MDAERTHCLVLLQPAREQNSRTYKEANSVAEAIGLLVQAFERDLVALNPAAPAITYGPEHFSRYLDGVPDVALLVYAPARRAYEPRGRQWIKRHALPVLQKRAGAPAQGGGGGARR